MDKGQMGCPVPTRGTYASQCLSVINNQVNHSESETGEFVTDLLDNGKSHSQPHIARCCSTLLLVGFLACTWDN